MVYQLNRGAVFSLKFGQKVFRCDSMIFLVISIMYRFPTPVHFNFDVTFSDWVWLITSTLGQLQETTPIAIVGGIFGISVHSLDQWTAKHQWLFMVFCWRRLKDGSILCEKTIICWSFLLSGSDPSIGYYGAIVEKCLALICNYSSISIVFIHRSNNMSMQMIASLRVCLILKVLLFFQLWILLSNNITILI